MFFLLREKVVNWIGAVVITLLIPFSITMVMTGVIGTNSIIDNFQSSIKIQLNQDNGGQIVDLEEYVIGVLAAQIPVDYEMSAIEAQAVVARTNITRYSISEKTTDQADMPFAYVSKAKMLENWGENNYEKNYNRFRLAVSKTVGVTMRYEGEYIDALYHNVSIGTTVSAKEAYGKKIDYLVSVESGHDLESPDYMKIEEHSYEDVQKNLKDNNLTVSIEDLKNNIAITDKTVMGYVKDITIGDISVTGDKWREMFELNSTNFYLEDYQGKLRVICLGKGHGMGLSQYGANELAQSGSNYEEILKYYFTGIEIYNATKQPNSNSENKTS